jgi:hypothetical protein
VTSSRAVLRYSLDGGSTYKTASTDYARGFITSSGTTVTAAGTNTITFAPLTLLNTNIAQSLPFNATMSPGGTGVNARIQSVSNGQDGSGITTVIDTTAATTSGKVTHIQILPDTGSFAVGTSILVEGF